MKKNLLVFFGIVAVILAAMLAQAPDAQAKPEFFTAQYCNACHYDDPVSCSGCHAHGVHSKVGGSDINLAAVTDKDVYQPGETMTVSVSGGTSHGGWVRVMLYDESGVEVARSSGPGGTGSGEMFPGPIVLSATAPATPGTYTFSASWYGNQYDKAGALFGDWMPDPGNPNHGEEVVPTNSFAVESAQVTVPDIAVTDSVAPAGDLQVPFGDVTEGAAAEQTVTVTNNGNADLSLGSIGVADPLADPFGIAGDTCSGQTLAPSAACSVTVLFSPVLSGGYSDSFDIPSNDPDEDPVTVSVSGNGTNVTVPDIAVTDSVAPAGDLQVPFGDVTEGAAAEQTVTVTNNGSAALSLGSIGVAASLADPFSITGDTCSGQTLAPSAACSVTVLFSPALSGGYSDSFDIPSNDPDENPVTVSVSGNGLSSVSNNLPDVPELVFPANGQDGLGTTLQFRWKDCHDPDGDNVTYTLLVCEDAGFSIGCKSMEVAFSRQKGFLYAGTGSGLLLLFGMAFSGMAGVRRRTWLILPMIAIAGLLLASCGSSDSISTPAPPTGAEVTQEVTGLQAGTTYYWKVIADDGNGGTAESETSSFTTQ